MGKRKRRNADSLRGQPLVHTEVGSVKSESELRGNIFDAAEFGRHFPEGALREVSCNLCRSEEAALLFMEGVYGVRKCKSCGLVYVSPQPTREALKEYYARFYPVGSDEAEVSWDHTVSFRQMRRILRRYCPQGGKLLDVGSGLGLFLRTLGAEWGLAGVDPDSHACERARHTVPHAEIVEGDAESLSAALGEFDAVTVMATLDHITDPALALRRIRDALKPGGLILVRVAYMRGYLSLKGAIPKLPIRIGAPRHLYDFSPRALRLILERNGYEVARFYVGSRERVARKAVAGVVAVKALSKLVYYLSGRRWLMPFCGSLIAVARRVDESPSA
jgi:ubiquinone/menaquinone biosynthesis C-methylase UbiE